MHFNRCKDARRRCFSGSYYGLFPCSKAADILKSHIYFPDSRDEAITACFHVMESVSIPKGVVVTSRGTEDYTQYTVFLRKAGL